MHSELCTLNILMEWLNKCDVNSIYVFNLASLNFRLEWNGFTCKPYLREPYLREPYLREPYLREPYLREPYLREPYLREPYLREPYLVTVPP